MHAAKVLVLVLVLCAGASALDARRLQQRLRSRAKAAGVAAAPTFGLEVEAKQPWVFALKEVEGGHEIMEVVAQTETPRINGEPRYAQSEALVGPSGDLPLLTFSLDNCAFFGGTQGPQILGHLGVMAQLTVQTQVQRCIPELITGPASATETNGALQARALRLYFEAQIEAMKSIDAKTAEQMVWPTAGSEVNKFVAAYLDKVAPPVPLFHKKDIFVPAEIVINKYNAKIAEQAGAFQGLDKYAVKLVAPRVQGPPAKAGFWFVHSFDPRDAPAEKYLPVYPKPAQVNFAMPLRLAIPAHLAKFMDTNPDDAGLVFRMFRHSHSDAVRFLTERNWACKDDPEVVAFVTLLAYTAELEGRESSDKGFTVFLFKTGVRDLLRGIASDDARKEIYEWWKAEANKDEALNRLCDYGNENHDQFNIAGCKTYLKKNGKVVFDLDEAVFSGESDENGYGHDYKAETPSGGKITVTNHPLPLSFISTATGGKEAAVVIEIRGGPIYNKKPWFFGKRAAPSETKNAAGLEDTWLKSLDGVSAVAKEVVNEIREMAGLGHEQNQLIVHPKHPMPKAKPVKGALKPEQDVEQIVVD